VIRMRDRLLAEASEEELVQLARERNQEAFAELMRRNASVSYRLALSVLKDRQDAEDQVQTSFLKAWLHLPGFQGDSRFSTWLRSIVTNQSLMRLRQIRRVRLESIDTEEDGIAPWEQPSVTPDPEDQLARKELIERVRREVQCLPPLFREVVMLRDFERRSVEEVASELQISIPATKSRLSRAREMLRKRMEQYVVNKSGTPVL